MEPMPDDMKDSIRKKKEMEMIHQRIHAQRRTKFPIRDRETWVLPEDFTGVQWKKSLQIIKGRKLKLKKKRRTKK
jgi:hypothetical protein